MKTIALAAIAALTFSSTAMADDFDYTALTTTVNHGELEFSVTGVLDNTDVSFEDAWMVTVGTDIANYKMGDFDANAFLYAGYGQVAGIDAVGLGLDYTVSQTHDGNTLSFGVDSLYVAETGDLGDGVLAMTPNVGLDVAVAEQFTVFGEVGYTFDATNDFDSLGGYAELGVDVSITDTVSVRPSVIRSFDTGADSTQAAVELVLSF